MCFEPDSSPPIDPIEGAATNHNLTTLTASDGNRFSAYEAFAENGGRSGVVILPDVRGLYRFYEDLAVRLAEAGHDAIAIDYFGRTAGVGERDDDFPYQDHVPQVTYEGMTADVAAAVERLRQSNPERSIFTMGFCFGGSSAWQQCTCGHGLAGAIGFYGRPDGRRPVGAPTPIELTPEMSAPVLALMGGDDPSIPAATIAAFERALVESGVEHEVVTYPGAPHSFFDRKYDDFAGESADAWTRVLAFIDAHS
ncbi:MAG: dienelactone hydrolase family protein [Acidimicrobiia bacterium]